MLALPDSLIRRRSILFGAAALGALRALPSIATPRPHAELSERTRDPRETLRLYVKLNGDASGKPYYSWFSGHVFAVEQGMISTPLFGVEGYGMGWAAPQPDGSYKQIWKEVGFYKDLKTDAILEKWRNPLNGADCEVMHINNRSVNFTMYPHGISFSPPGMQVSSGGDQRHFGEPGPQDFTLPWFVNGDRVATSMDTMATGPNPLNPKEWPRESRGDRLALDARRGVATLDADGPDARSVLLPCRDAQARRLRGDPAAPAGLRAGPLPGLPDAADAGGAEAAAGIELRGVQGHPQAAAAVTPQVPEWRRIPAVRGLTRRYTYV
jgi:hypothetical protein